MSANQSSPEYRSQRSESKTPYYLALAALVAAGGWIANEIYHDNQAQNAEESQDNAETTSDETVRGGGPNGTATQEAVEILATAIPLMPEEDADENVSLGIHNEGQQLLTNEDVNALIVQTLLDLENNPEHRDRILANQRWMDDLLNPNFTNWSDRNLLERDFRGLAFTPEILTAASAQQEDWDELFTQESLARSQDPNLVDSSRTLLQFAVDPIALARAGELNIGVSTSNAEYYLVNYGNIANIQTTLYAAAVDALIASGVDASDATIREAAVIFANNWRQFHGLTNAAGMTNVDTNGGEAGGEVQFRHGPFLRVCEVYQSPAASNDPLDQVETTRIVNVVPLTDIPNELTTQIPWGSYESNERGHYTTAVRIGHISGQSTSAAGLAQELLLASAQTTWNHTDNYIDVGSDYETERNAVFHTYLPCAEAPVEVIPTVEPVIEPTAPPAQSCEERGDCNDHEETCEELNNCEKNGGTNDGAEALATEAAENETTAEEANIPGGP